MAEEKEPDQSKSKRRRGRRSRGWKLTAAQRKNQSEGHKGIVPSAETRRKMSESQTKRRAREAEEKKKKK